MLSQAGHHTYIGETIGDGDGERMVTSSLDAHERHARSMMPSGAQCCVWCIAY